MTSYNETVKDLVLNFYEMGALKFGEFKMKCGPPSPVYFDIRNIVSRPRVLHSLANILYENILKDLEFEHICGVPYTALPIGCALSLKFTIPMLMRRKEAKEYGTGKMIEGDYKEEDSCVIIEDVVTSGSSILETAQELRDQKIIVTDSIVILDRQQGGSACLQSQGIRMRSLLTLLQVIDILCEAEKIDPAMKETVRSYLYSHQFSPRDLKVRKSERLQIHFENRYIAVKNEAARKLLMNMVAKETNLCVTTDLTRSSDIIKLFESVARYICIFKIRSDTIEDFDENFVSQLKQVANRHNVMLMEERKFGDVPDPIILQFTNEFNAINEWADFFTIHISLGPGIIEAIKTKIENLQRGLFIAAEIKLGGNKEYTLTNPGVINRYTCMPDDFFSSAYVEGVVKMAYVYYDVVAGLICKNSELVPSSFIQLTPDLKPQSIDNLKEFVIKGVDVVVLGRDIMKSISPETIEKYKNEIWAEYKKRFEPYNKKNIFSISHI